MSEDNTIGGLQKTNTKIKWHKTGKNIRIIKSMPGKYKQKLNRDHNIIMKAEVLSVTWGREKKQNEKSKPFET